MSEPGPGARKKIRRFGLLGAIGCLVGALVGEQALALLLPASAPPPPPPPRVDILFLLDVTGSMQMEIDGVRSGFRGFVTGLSSRDVDARVGLIAFRDNLNGEPSTILDFGGQPFTADAGAFSAQVGALRATGGGDEPESSLDTLVDATRQPFRAGAVKVLVLITDAPPTVPDARTPSIQAAALAVQNARIDQLHLVIQEGDRDDYAELRSAVPGEIFSLAETAAGREGFDRILPRIGRRIATVAASASMLQSKARPYRFDRLLLVTSLWSALVTLGLSIALIMGQNRFQRRPLLTIGQGAACVVGSLLAGIAAGAIGQLLFAAAPSMPIAQALGRILAWALLGALVGRGMAFFVPNLAWDKAMKGGAVGGALGAIGFQCVALLLSAAGPVGDKVGRLIGAAILGFLVGLMIALVEFLFGRPVMGKNTLRANRVRIGKSYRVR